MRAIFGLVLVIGISLAGFAAWKTQEYVTQSQARERAARSQIVPTTDVYVVTEALSFGAELKPEHVRRIAWPRQYVPENAFLAEETLFPPNDSRPRLVTRDMEKFEPVLTSKVTAPGADAGLNTRLTRGMRAFTVRVDATSGVSGHLRDGDRVDIYWTGNTQGLEDYSERDVTRLIEAGVRIIATDQGSGAAGAVPTTAGGQRSVTVEASPQQVARLAQAQATGRIALSLVGVQDDTNEEVVEINRRDLLGMGERQVEVITEERVCTIRTRRGGELVEIPIPCTN